MQLHLETDELDLLANILVQRIGETAAQAISAGPVKPSIGLAPDPRRYDDLLDKVLARDLKFDSDELECVAGLLTGQERDLRDEIARQPNAALKNELQKQLAVLERVLERVDEACVMI
ncbi:MAG TPA: hypothetical protein VIH91_02595 [Terriglobales bacterium]